ncbi:PREDICTED: 5-oxoprolinase-like, partial [Ficedula albicollis]|uniref:5-oxoprolinase-like n=1 Tax=Ficedula albicollis TaxID=59894 RepID=UPI0003593A07
CSGVTLLVQKPLDLGRLRGDLEGLLGRGFRSLAVLLLHGYASGLYVVGPESAGAHPGPACYRKGGPLTVTDANLVLGRLLPDFFPRIFGPGEDEPLCRDTAVTAFRALAATIGDFRRAGDAGDAAGVPKEPPSVEEVALGFIRVANEAMCRPIRALTQVGVPGVTCVTCVT